MSLQGLTIALSQSGISYFASTQLVSKLTTAMAGLVPPDKVIPVADIAGGSSKYSHSTYEGISVHLSSGSLSSFTPAFKLLTQGNAGEFTLELEATNFLVNYTWFEQYYLKSCSLFSCHNGPEQTGTYPYRVAFASMSVVIVFKFDYTNNAWNFAFVSATPNAGKVTPTIPPKSLLNQQDAYGCFQSKISDATKAAVDTIDFKQAVESTVKPLFASIPSSGKLTKDIVFEFELGPSGLVFPGNAGMQTGVNGVATYQGNAYPGANPPQLAVPAVPAGHHLAYHASDYTFNSLFWSYYSGGLLKSRITAGELPDPEVLNTKFFQNSIQALWNKYPDLPMTATVQAKAAPTVTFKDIYELTAAGLATLANLPPTTQKRLADMKGEVYLTETDFYAELTNFIGSAAAAQYKTEIETAATIEAAVVLHEHRGCPQCTGVTGILFQS